MNVGSGEVVSAGATRVVVDGLADSGKVFARIGANATRDSRCVQLIDRMSHLHCGTTAANSSFLAREPF